MKLTLPNQNESSKPKLVERVCDLMRLHHYSIRTEQSYSEWIRRYILFHHKKHPLDLGAEGVRDFLTYLATERR
jgi:hypothetical protein